VAASEKAGHFDGGVWLGDFRGSDLIPLKLKINRELISRLVLHVGVLCVMLRKGRVRI
jgi:hypothetical protein